MALPTLQDSSGSCAGLVIWMPLGPRKLVTWQLAKRMMAVPVGCHQPL